MPLITTISELKKYINIDANMRWASIEPYVKEAEQLYIVPLLGKAFYDQYLPLYTASVAPSPTPLSADNAALLPYIQRTLAFYTQLKAIPQLATSFGDLGLRQHLSENSTTAAIKVEDRLLLNALVSGDTHADALLTFLEENATVSKYGLWFSSAANTRMSGLIVYGTGIAQKHIDISNSRRMFLQLLPYIKKIEEKYVPKLVGADQYDELVTQLQTGGAGIPTAANLALIEKIEPIIAKRVLFMRLPYLRVSIAHDGLWLYSGANEVRSKDFLATDTLIKTLRLELSTGDLGYEKDEEELQQFINDNIDDYPLIEASSVYTVQPDPKELNWQPLNDPNNNHFAV